jgi:hypothetical protein
VRIVSCSSLSRSVGAIQSAWLEQSNRPVCFHESRELGASGIDSLIIEISLGPFGLHPLARRKVCGAASQPVSVMGRVSGPAHRRERGEEFTAHPVSLPMAPNR